VLHHTYKHQPFYLKFVYKRRLAALVPFMEVRSPFTGRRGVCVPFSDCCEPLIFEPDVKDEVRDRLLTFAREREWHHVEIRGGKSVHLGPAAASRFYGHTLDLTGDCTRTFGRFASSVRRAIRKAERSEVSFIGSILKRGDVTAFHHSHCPFSSTFTNI
jgi:hypothetical protein